MGYHLSPSSYPRDWKCSECNKAIYAIAGRFKIYNNNQVTCGKDCALARKTRRQAERRAERQAALYGAPAANLMPSPDASEAAHKRELFRRERAADHELLENQARRRDAAATLTGLSTKLRPRALSKPPRRRGR